MLFIMALYFVYSKEVIWMDAVVLITNGFHGIDNIRGTKQGIDCC